VDPGRDSEGNEWKMGHVDGGDDSDLGSDRGLGESDEQRFADLTFREITSARKKKKGKPGQGLEAGSEGHDGSSEDGEGL